VNVLEKKTRLETPAKLKFKFEIDPILRFNPKNWDDSNSGSNSKLTLIVVQIQN
jgi:hypothetical protein